MIEKIHIKNFKCLQDTEVTLGPFNVLIGPNDSGKTSFLQAIELLAAPQFGDMRSLVWHKENDREIAFEVSGPAVNPFHYRLALAPATGMGVESLSLGNQIVMEVSNDSQHGWILKNSTGHGRALDPNQRALFAAADWEKSKSSTSGPVADFLKMLLSSGTFRLDPQAMRAAVSATPNPSLDPTGKNLAAVLQAMLSGPDRKAILELESKLHDAIPTLKGISLSTHANSTHLIEFTLDVDVRPPITIPCSQASDGAMLLTGFLVLVYGNSPKRLLIEEPENGLHPGRLKMVIDILRKISTGEIGNEPRQVIVTTHSPLLLNFVQPEEVRVFRRDENQGTKVVSMDSVPSVAKLRKEFAPGELWYLFGEEELVNGKAS
jgi:predicted ATPase